MPLQVECLVQYGRVGRELAANLGALKACQRRFGNICSKVSSPPSCGMSSFVQPIGADAKFYIIKHSLEPPLALFPSPDLTDLSHCVDNAVDLGAPSLKSQMYLPPVPGLHECVCLQGLHVRRRRSRCRLPAGNT